MARGGAAACGVVERKLWPIAALLEVVGWLSLEYSNLPPPFSLAGRVSVTQNGGVASQHRMDPLLPRGRSSAPHSAMKLEEFNALAKLLRLREGAARDVAQDVMVTGANVPAAATEHGLPYVAAHKAVTRVRKGLELARRACGLSK